MKEDLEEMMYGFGSEEWPPDPDAVSLMEVMVTNFIEDLTSRAQNVADLTGAAGSGKIDKECFMYLVRKDSKKFNRVHRLLQINEEVSNTNKQELKEEENR